MKGLVPITKTFVKRNAPTILTCMAGVGVVATSVMAVKATPKALKLMELAEKEKGEKLTKMEIVQVAGPVYIPAALMGVSTLACVFGANALNKRHQAAIMSAYALLDNSYKEYKKKVDELYGEGANKRVISELAKDKYDGVEVEDDKQLFYDSYSERYFTSTMAEVIAAQYKINRKLAMWNGAYLNEFYEALDIPTTDYGGYVGWSADHIMETTWNDWLEFDHEKVVLDDGLECCIITFGVEPEFNFLDYS